MPEQAFHRLTCPGGCGKEMKSPDRLIGKKVQCPRCKLKFRLPSPVHSQSSSTTTVQGNLPREDEPSSKPSVDSSRDRTKQRWKPRTKSRRYEIPVEFLWVAWLLCSVSFYAWLHSRYEWYDSIAVSPTTGRPHAASTVMLGNFFVAALAMGITAVLLVLYSSRNKDSRPRTMREAARISKQAQWEAGRTS